MKKGERTRDHILAQSAAVFNQHGYAASSMSDLMLATKLEKGGIYNHFASKEQLELAAFDYAVELIEQRYLAALEKQQTAIDRLGAVMDIFLEFIHDPVLPGGCPVLNAAIESDDSNESLRQRTKLVVTGWKTRIQGIIEIGIAKGELEVGTDAGKLATVMLATLEGAVMMSKVCRDAIHMRHAASFLEDYFQSLSIKQNQTV